ncbi:MAG TPA: hypothetical protein VGF13_18950, partial [Verrucomicrobiae bacterium]
MSNKSTNDTNVFLWIVIACLLVSLIVSIGVFVWFNARKPTAIVQAIPTRSSSAPAPGKVATSFAEVAEADVPGRYKIADPNKVMYIVLNEDHTFINEDGTTYVPYRWDISPGGFTIMWQRIPNTWNVFEAPTVYSRTKTDGTTSRMEKLPDLPPADTISISDKDVVASMIFTAIIQTNGLTPANLEADGAIFPGEADGQECYQLIRSRSRMSAFLYVRIAPE